MRSPRALLCLNVNSSVSLRLSSYSLFLSAGISFAALLCTPSNLSVFFKVRGLCLYCLLYSRYGRTSALYRLYVFVLFLYVSVLYISPSTLLTLFLAAVHFLDGFMS